MDTPAGIRIDGNGGTLAEHIRWRPNARLIAAAPEMLEALREVYGMKQQNEFYANLVGPIIAKATREDRE